MDKKGWRVAYMDHGPYSASMDLEEAIMEFRKEEGAYIVRRDGKVIHSSEIRGVSILIPTIGFYKWMVADYKHACLRGMKSVWWMSFIGGMVTDVALIVAASYVVWLLLIAN